jgi:hypothetical protein
VYVSRFLYVIREAWVLGSSGFVAWYGIEELGLFKLPRVVVAAALHMQVTLRMPRDPEERMWASAPRDEADLGKRLRRHFCARPSHFRAAYRPHCCWFCLIPI